MKKHLLALFVILSACARNDCDIPYIRPDDGLTKPNKTEIFCPVDKDGIIYGITRKDIFTVDVNNDGKKDKITRGRFDTMTAHGYTFYDIELSNGEKLNQLRTLESAECFLEFYRFQLSPFVITKYSRPLGADSWFQPTESKIETFVINGDKLEKTSEKKAGVVCDVSKLK